MGVTSSIRLCFPMRKSTLLPYPDGNDKGRKFPSRTFTRLDDQTWGIPIFFFLARCGASLFPLVSLSVNASEIFIHAQWRADLFFFPSFSA